MNSEQGTFDLVIIGGGINGAGIAADAAGRGLKVLLCEMNDLASATSSSSSKLIHGGLRYLEYHEYRLVREALAEREVLLQKAPHIIWPLRFRLPHRPHLRPAWLIRAGLFLYDHLAKRNTLPSSHSIRFKPDGPLVNEIRKGFEYSDAWVDDARLVVLNAITARDKGAHILTRTRCVHAERHSRDNEPLWDLTLENQLTGQRQIVSAKALVNAAGPWVTQFFDNVLDRSPPKQIRLVKGSHIIVPRLHDEPEAYILQNEDNRIVFVLPYEEQFSLIGTTDVEHQGDPASACISEEETEYLISVTNAHFKTEIQAKDVVASYAGVRPLLDDEADSPAAVTRDYTIELEQPQGQAPLLSVFGGKVTTYRKLAEAAVNQLENYFPQMGKPWTAFARLPGGDFDTQQNLRLALQQKYPWLPSEIVKRYVRSYGTLSHQILSGCSCLEQMGEHFGAGLYQLEVEYLISNEWALEVEDILWRRTKLGLFLSSEQLERLAEVLETANLMSNPLQAHPKEGGEMIEPGLRYWPGKL